MVFAASLTAYAATAARSLCWGDSAEFVAVASTLGVAHPPGYPLYTLLGALAVRVPVGTPFLRMSLLSAVFAAAAAAAAALVVWAATGRTNDSEARPTVARVAGALFAGGVLASGPSFWSQAVVPEVYSLSAFLTLSVLLLFTVWARTRGRQGTVGSLDPGSESGGLPVFLLRDRPLVVLGLAAGLALAHHLTVVLLLVPLAVALFFVGRLPSIRSILAVVGLIVVGLSLYLYLPLRAAHDPAILWTPVGTWRELVDHITGAQYAPLLFAAPVIEVGHKLSIFFAGVPREVTWVCLVLAAPGLAWFFARTWVPAFVLATWGLLVVAHAAVYRIPDVESYYLPVYAVLSIAGGAGLAFLSSARAWRRALPIVGRLALVAAVVVPVSAARRSWKENDLRTFDDGRVYLERMLDEIDHGGVVVTMTDRVLFPLWYARHVERERSDFSVFSVRERAPHLERWCTGVRFPREDELCSSFETRMLEGKTAREAIPVGNYLPLILSLNVTQRPFYTDADLARRLFVDHSLPRGLLVEISARPFDAIPAEALREHVRFWGRITHSDGAEPPLRGESARVYATTLAEHGALLLERGETRLAVQALEQACELAPNVPLCHSNLGVAYEREGRREEALAQFEAAIVLNPGLAEPHHNIAVAYRRIGDHVKARQQLELAISLEPDNPLFRMELGGLLEEESEFDAAEEMLRSASDLSTDDWGASLAYGDFLRRRRRYADAVAAYKRAEELRPESTGALRGLGRCYWALDDRERALEVSRRLVELQPHNPAAKFDLALMLYRSGRGRQAVVLLDDVIRLLPSMWEARALKATVLGELERYGEARNLFGTALELGASGEAFWESWISMEKRAGDARMEAEVRERADAEARERAEADLRERVAAEGGAQAEGAAEETADGRDREAEGGAPEGVAD